jgi:Domain of unknown function DUF11
MATRRFTRWTCLLLVSGLSLDLSIHPTFGQGEEEVSQAATSERGFAGALQRIFGTRDSSEPSQRSSSSSPERSAKPPANHGSFAKQLRSFVNPPSKDEEDGGNARTGSEAGYRPNIPTTPSRMAQRQSREPFSNPPPRNLSNSQQSSQSTSSGDSRDIFSEDPPSLVGTGVHNRSLPTSSSVKAKLQSPDSPSIPRSASSNTTSPLVGADKDNSVSGNVSSRSKANINEASEVPRVSRKTVPVTTQGQSNPSPSAPPRTYAIPGNPYTAPPSLSDTNRYSGVGPSATKPGSPNSTTTAVPPSLPTESRFSNQGSTPANDSTLSNAPSLSSTASNPKSDTRAEMSIPKVKLFVSGPSALQVGKAVPYEVLVRNEGNEILSGVIVSMVVPAFVKTSLPVASAGEYDSEKDAQGVETYVWHVTDLGPLQTRTFRLSLEASKPEQFSMDVEWTVLPQIGKVQVAVQQPQLNLGLEGPTKVLWGKPEVYRLLVRNPGNADVKDVQIQLTAESYGSNQSKIGDIAAGAEKVVEVELTFQQTGIIKLAGVASSSLQELEANSMINVSVEQIDLATEWVGMPEQYQGSIAEHKLSVTNRSQVPAENVNCFANIPPSFKVVSMPPGATLHGNQARWTIPRIEPNIPTIYEFALQAMQTGNATLTSEVKSLGGGNSNAELLVKVDAISDLRLTVNDPVAPAPVGLDVVYDLTITNRGSKAATAVSLLAQFSNGIEPIRTEGGASRVLPGQVVFEPIPVIEPGQEVTLRVVAQASEPGMHRFRAELQCEEGETQLVEEESTRYLATTKTDAKPATIRR